MVDKTIQRFGIALILTGGFLDLNYVIRLGRMSSYRILVFIGLFVFLVGFALTLSKHFSGA